MSGEEENMELQGWSLYLGSREMELCYKPQSLERQFISYAAMYIF
jgi:hypothetical protein